MIFLRLSVKIDVTEVSIKLKTKQNVAWNPFQERFATGSLSIVIRTRLCLLCSFICTILPPGIIFSC